MFMKLAAPILALAAAHSARAASTVAWDRVAVEQALPDEATFAEFLVPGVMAASFCVIFIMCCGTCCCAD